mmetsp:Transcript_383/g.671  ORF Transcript_383/g.671 Transcript_383/m.671 type:complete len:614 (-) Transcript_383:174-2015(-)
MFQDRDIVTPHANDVLCGRGNFANTHEGNRNWHRLVTANKELYAALPKFHKQLLSQSIVSAVTSQNPPGRFLQRDSVSQLWYNVGENKAIEKTSQALREGGIQARSEQLLEKGITPESLNLASPQFDASQLTTTATATMSGEQQTPSAINIYMPSVKDARKIVKKVEEPASVQATSMYNSQQQTYGSLRHEMYGHQQEKYSNPPYRQQQQPVSYDHPYGHQVPPIMHPNPYNHHQYPPPPPPPPQGPPPSNSMPYPSHQQQQRQQHPPTHPPLLRGMEPLYASVSSNANRPPCGSGGGASHAPSLSSHVSEERAAEIIAAAVAAAAADSIGNNTMPATDGNHTHANLPCCCYPPTGSNNTTQEVESVSTQGSKVSPDVDLKRKGRSSKAPKESVVTSSPHVARSENANAAATTTTARPDPLAKPAASLGSISAMSVSGIMPTIQTSFGSMSLEESYLKKATMPNKIDTSVPTLTLHERSKGDLLDDSDRDNDDDDDDNEEEEMSNPSASDWEKMQKVLGITENDFRPVGNVTGMDLTRDISEMSREISGMSMGDFSLDRSPSSTYMMRDTTVGSIGGRKKDDYEMSEEEKIEKMLLGRGSSLVNEYYGTSEQK